MHEILDVHRDILKSKFFGYFTHAPITCEQIYHNLAIAVSREHGCSQHLTALHLWVVVQHNTTGCLAALPAALPSGVPCHLIFFCPPLLLALLPQIL
jgi:hypothetical protein